jgi:hypothetical protein
MEATDLNIDINVYLAPPAAAQLEAARTRLNLMFGGFAFAALGCCVLLGLRIRDLMAADALPDWMADWPVLLLAAALLLFIWKLVKLWKFAGRIEDTAPITCKAIMEGSDSATVKAYCKAVKQQGRMLTMEEAEALMALCTSEASIEKIAAVYEKDNEVSGWPPSWHVH